MHPDCCGRRAANPLSRTSALLPWIREHIPQTPARAARNIRTHYDRPTQLYRQFLDDRLVYSCAYFRDPGVSLEQAQLAKLEHVCRKLDLKPGVQSHGEALLSTRWRQTVFPGSQLVHISEALRAAERAGFEVLDVENLRPHYALTCRHWVARLQRNREACLEVVDSRTYRSWLLMLPVPPMDVFQMLLAPRGSPARPFTREYMYAEAVKQAPG